MILKYILPLLSVVAFSTADAQTNAGPVRSNITNQPLAAGQKQDQKKGGIRFLLRNKERQLPTGMVAQIDEKTFLPIELSALVPGSRIPLPKDGILRIYPEIPQKGKLIKPLYSGPIPTAMGKVMLGIVSDLGDSLRIDFVSERELMPGRVFFMNLTNKPFLVNVKNVKGEPAQISLNPETKYVFGKAQRVTDTSISFPAQLMHQVDTKAGKMWLTERKFQVICYERQSSVVLIIPDKSATDVIFYSTSFYLHD